MYKIGFIALGTLLALVSSTPALGLQITFTGSNNPDPAFNNNLGGQLAGEANIGNSTLNTNTGTSGFNSEGGPNSQGVTSIVGFFTTNYGRLGALGSTQGTPASESGTFRRISDPFEFLAADLNNFGFQNVTFDYAFDGTSPAGTTTLDTLTGYFALASSPSQAIAGGTFFSTNQLINLGGVNDASFNTASSLFSTNTDYIIAFQLDEAFDSGNTGAGFDDVRLTSVPFEFSPGVGILALSALGAMAQLKGKLKNRKPLQVGALNSNDG